MMAAENDLTSLLAVHRIGHLATADAVGSPHVVPICFVYDGHAIYSAIDHKPKRRTGYGMKRIRNIVENSQVAFLVHHYEENWQRLAYVMVRGTASILEIGDERQHAMKLLEAKYVQYRERRLAQGEGFVIKIVPVTFNHWNGQETTPA